ncbi:MAG: hypothetical protein JOY96_06995 [Verrucomicrobia bacterium]|nr:hypothetical protein [Verrucomicrobiota bacterium]
MVAVLGSFKVLRHPGHCASVPESLPKSIDMKNLAEIQEAIEKLAPEERVELREWFEASDPETMGVIRQRVGRINAGGATLLDGDRVQQEMRELARQIAKE